MGGGVIKMKHFTPKMKHLTSLLKLVMINTVSFFTVYTPELPFY